MYEAIVTWTNREGKLVCVRSRPNWDRDEARTDAVELAKQHGWKPPRWWQWRRRPNIRIEAAT